MYWDDRHRLSTDCYSVKQTRKRVGYSKVDYKHNSWTLYFRFGALIRNSSSLIFKLRIVWIFR